MKRCRDCGQKTTEGPCPVCENDRRIGAAEWKDLRPRRRTGPFLRVRDKEGKVLR